ncbi:OLC1v1006973C1 [Oldenlandia corymbosa var. corymbosa]|uniref:OLC1v1006973C1 n=1 Tax=Oldenlandia corymbosa var. corymbosa TaxID=529605 RepID=A0AAV1DKL4_OLDCO|nr:OLC1v1006973C1 [Oldenlandia corymbosa var. corymbosa]
MSATMMNHSRRQSLPSTGNNNSSSNKRKERDGYIDGFKPSALTTKNLARPSIHHRAPAPAKSPKPASPAAAAASSSGASNKLLAGYLAHEFLTKGTLFGETWDPARAEAGVPLSSSSASSSTSGRGRPAHPMAEKRKAEPSGKAEEEDERKRIEKQRRYVEVADLLRTDGVHIPGIVNPTQLARFLQL